MKRIYISGPISGKDYDERKAAFSAVKKSLEAKGYEAISPMENGLNKYASTHLHMHRDIELLMSCDAIYMMEGWLHSKGCKLEFDVATAIGIDVWFEEAQQLPADKSRIIKFK